jgi:uncharacterized protein YukE
VPDGVRVTPEDLHVSAATVDMHADTMHARHFEADDRMESAQPGMPMGSAAALTAAVAKWQADTSAMFGRMIDHSHGLRTGATAYQRVDDEAAADVSRAEHAVSGLDLGL